MKAALLFSELGLILDIYILKVVVYLVIHALCQNTGDLCPVHRS